MVRTIFFALLLLNLVYFAWAHWIDIPSPAPTDGVTVLPPLKLAEEVSPEQRSSRNVAEKNSPNAAAPCLSVGPLTDPDNSARLAALLRGRGLDPKERAEDEQSSDGYWVYLGGLKSEAEVDKTLVTLEHGGIKDAVPMPETPDAGRRLSLGMFSERSRAERRAQTVREQTGLSAQIAERRLPTTSYWIDVTPVGGQAVLQQLLAQAPGPHVAFQPCATQPADAPPPGTATAARIQQR